VLVAHLEHRPVAAGAEAFDLDYREEAVSTDLLDAADTGLLHAGSRDVVGTAQPAAGGTAHLNLVAADRAPLEHGVETDDLVHADRRHVEELGHVLDRRHRKPAVVLLLRQVEQPEDGACLPALRIARDIGLRLLDVLRGELEVLGLWRNVGGNLHRSTSPKTISMEPRMATESASMCPRHMKS